MLIQIIMLMLLCVFYFIYFAKAVMLKKQGISVDLLGKGDKPKKAVCIEIILKTVTVCGALIKFTSTALPNLIWSFNAVLTMQIIGCVLAAAGVILFGFSITEMRNNWRAGFDKNQNTSLVTNGIYKISRNPAFAGFDLLYIGCSIAFPNIIMILISLIALIAFHIQILSEEQFLTEKFGQEYIDYKAKVKRYL